MESRAETERWFAMLNDKVAWTLQKKYICPKCMPNESFVVYHSRYDFLQICAWCGSSVKDMQQDCVIIIK